MTRSLVGVLLAACVTMAVVTPAAAIQERAPACECQPGYYHRRADGDDLMCVTAKSRALIQAENAAAGDYTQTDGYCISGFVFRDAFNGDGVCVDPDSRSRVHAENRAPMTYADPDCEMDGYLGLHNSNDNPNDD